VGICLSLDVKLVRQQHQQSVKAIIILLHSDPGSMARLVALPVLLILGSCLILSGTTLADSNSNDNKDKVKVKDDDRVSRNEYCQDDL
jgi:hypothetical protein